MPEANLDRCDSCGADLSKVGRGRIASGPGAWCAKCEADLAAYMKRQARAPKNPREWSEVPMPIASAGSLDSHAYVCGPIRVLSELLMADSPTGTGEVVPQWYVSITDRGKRPKPHHVRKALRAFNMVASEQDNHGPGNARHFWLPVDPAHRVDCECKVDEQVFVDPDGYRWSNPIDDDSGCMACQLGRVTGKPCPVHAGGDHAQR